jgi:hypothetical protein
MKSDNKKMLWRRMNGVTLVGLVVCTLGAWLAYDAGLITKGGMVPVMQQTRDGWEETGDERWATAAQRRRERYAFAVLLLITGAILGYHGVKNAGETKSYYPDRFGPWVADKFHRIVAGAIFLAPAALILPTAIPWWISLVQELPGILQAAAIPTFFIVFGLPFCIGGISASLYWKRFALHNPRDHNAE